VFDFIDEVFKKFLVLRVASGAAIAGRTSLLVTMPSHLAHAPVAEIRARRA